MPEQHLDVLSYSSPPQPIRRGWEMVLAALPLAGGTIAGWFIAVGLLRFYSFEPTTGLIAVAMAFAGGFFILYAAAVLAAICFFDPRRRWRRRSHIFAAAVGVACQAIPAGAASAMQVYSGETPRDAATLTLGILAVLLISMGLAAPLFLIRARRPDVQSSPVRLSPRRILPPLVAIVLLAGAILEFGRCLQQSRLDRDCQAAIAWVRATHPAPGGYLHLQLPPALAKLSEDGLVSAAELPDGRVALLFRTSTGWMGTWIGYLYASAPLKPAEIGPGNLGQPHLLISELQDNDISVLETINPHEYLVGYSN